MLTFCKEFKTRLGRKGHFLQCSPSGPTSLFLLERNSWYNLHFRGTFFLLFSKLKVKPKRLHPLFLWMMLFSPESNASLQATYTDGCTNQAALRLFSHDFLWYRRWKAPCDKIPPQGLGCRARGTVINFTSSIPSSEHFLLVGFISIRFFWSCIQVHFVKGVILPEWDLVEENHSIFGLSYNSLHAI